MQAGPMCDGSDVVVEVAAGRREVNACVYHGGDEHRNPDPPLNSGVVDIEYIVRVQSTGVVSGNVETVALEDAIGAVLYVDGLQ
jgi:hypothetical protein